MSDAVLSISLTDQAKRTIAGWRENPRKLRAAISGGLTQVAEESAAHIQAAYFTGYRAGVSRAAKLHMVFNRSGALRQAVRPGRIDDFTVFVGASQGATSAYARTILGSDRTTITAKHAKFLWVPIADNLNASGVARYTPRAAMGLVSATGHRRLRIFKSKAGNLVAFLPDARGGSYGRGARKGRQRGQLLFTLKRNVVVKGSGALAHGVQDMSKRGSTILQKAIDAAKLEGAH